MPGGGVGAIYDKHHLVPFGEYMPLPELFRSLGIRALAQRVDVGFRAGPGPRVIDINGVRVLPLIFYEAVFPANARSLDDRADALLQITNDAWFGDFAGPQQHLAQARMRAIEQGLPLVRSANTGISAMVDAKGRVLASLALNERGVLDTQLPEGLSPTVYGTYGDTTFVILVVFGLICAAFGRYNRDSRKN